MIENIVVALVGGLFGVLPAAIQMLSNRAKRGSTAQKLASLSNDLNFLEQWARLSKEYGSDPLGTHRDSINERVRSDLDNLLIRYQALKEREASQQLREIVEISFFRRVFLLFVPVSGSGWLYHTLFYVLIFFSISMIVTGWQEPIINPETGENDFTNLLIGMAVILLPIAVFLVSKANKVRNCVLQEQQAASI